MKFKDREQAGRLLAEALAAYRGKSDVIVAALPRGGVVLGRIVADSLGAPLDIVVPRKIAAPENDEYAVGAITETGDVVWNPDERSRLSDAYVREATKREKAEAKRRLGLYRQALRPRSFKNKTVLLVDDGVATGYTIKAALKTVRAMKPKSVIVAVPVAPAGTEEDLRAEADDVIVLFLPALFGAIGAFYDSFPQVDDDTVIRLLHG